MAATQSLKTYRSEDSIANLNLRVTVTKVFGTGAAGVGGEDENEAVNVPEEVYAHTFKWQQKVFSPRLAKYYRETTGLVSQTEQEYKRNVAELDRTTLLDTTNNAQKYEGSRVFSYVNDDVFIPGYTDSEDVTKPPRSVSSPLADAVIEEWRARIEDGERAPETLQLSGYRVFFVMFEPPPPLNATVGGGSDVSEDDDVVLCEIRAYDSGRVDCRPGFGSETHFVAANHRFKCTVENLSDKHASRTREEDERLRMLERQQMMRVNMMGTFVQQPPLGSYRVTVMGEVVSLWGFDANTNLYCMYEVPLGAEWTVKGRPSLDAEPLAGVSQVGKSTTRVSEDGRTKYPITFINLPFSFELVFNPDLGFGLPLFPKFVFQVASYDSWDRNRSEGYGQVAIPSQPGYYDMEVGCWKPHGTIRDQLRSFFVGGAAELNELDYAGVPLTHEDKTPLNRYGVHTQSTGKVRVRFSVVIQEGKGRGSPSPGQRRRRRDPNASTFGGGASTPTLRGIKSPGLRAREAASAKKAA